MALLVLGTRSLLCVSSWLQVMPAITLWSVEVLPPVVCEVLPDLAIHPTRPLVNVDRRSGL